MPLFVASGTEIRPSCAACERDSSSRRGLGGQAEKLTPIDAAGFVKKRAWCNYFSLPVKLSKPRFWNARVFVSFPLLRLQRDAEQSTE